MLGRSWTLLRYLGLPEGAKENVRLIASKASVSVDDQDAGRRRLMAIVLRHPVDRAVSHFRYIHGTQFIGACTTRNLDPFNHTHFFHWYERFHTKIVDLDNFEVRLLVTNKEDPDFLFTADQERYGFRNDRQCHGTGHPLPRVTDQHLAWAVARLRRMSLIGIADDLPGTFDDWAQVLTHWPTDPLSGRRTTGMPTGERLCGNSDHRVCTSTRRAAHDEMAQLYPRQLARVEHHLNYSMGLYRAAVALHQQQTMYGEAIFGQRSRQRAEPSLRLAKRGQHWHAQAGAAQYHTRAAKTKK